MMTAAAAAGRWVAVKDGQVVAAAHSARELVPAVRKLVKEGRGAVTQYVPHRSDTIMLGIG
jgi:hypothetical protein